MLSIGRKVASGWSRTISTWWSPLFSTRLIRLRQLHRLGVREAVLRHLVPGIGRIEHALEAEHHVVGVERTARLEVGGAVEVHALAQVEAIAQAVVGHRPALGQRGHHRPLAGVELDQAIHQHIGRGVGGGQRVVLDHVEALGAGLGTHTQGGSGGGLGEQQGARNREKAARRMTGSIRTVNMPIRSGWAQSCKAVGDLESLP